MTRIMNHQAVRDLLPLYVDRGLDDRDSVESHLQGCADCRQELAELGQVVSLLNRAKPAPVPYSFALSERMIQQRRKRSFWDLIPTGPIWALRSTMAAAAVLLLFLVGGEARQVMDDRMPEFSASRSAATQSFSTFDSGRPAAAGAAAAPVPAQAGAAERAPTNPPASPAESADPAANRVDMTGARILGAGLIGVFVAAGSALYWITRRQV